MTDAEKTRAAGRALGAAAKMVASLPGNNQSTFARLKSKAVEVILAGASGFRDPYVAVAQQALDAKTSHDRVRSGAMSMQDAIPTIIAIRRAAAAEAIEGRWAGFWGLEALARTFTIVNTADGPAVADAISDAADSMAQAQDLLPERGNG